MNVFLYTFGCKANQADTEHVRQAFELEGATIVSDPEDADVAIINSCTVTHVAERKMRGLVNRLARRQPLMQTVVMGCAAALDDGTLARLPTVRAVVGGADSNDVLRAAGVEPTAHDPLLRRFQRGSRAWLKIQDGCDEHCTFCATTLARGANRSRPPAELLREAEALARHHAELVLTGVHIGSYGQDLADGSCLSSLLEQLLETVPGVRFRLSSLEATEIDERLRQLFAQRPADLAPHVHAPLQSGSNPLLKRMGRHWYTADTYREALEAVVTTSSGFALGADVIVGFPGEGDADHRATVELIEALPFTYLHVFPYSQRAGTAAVRLGDPVAPPVQQARAAELRALAKDKAAAYRASRRGARADGVATRHRFGQIEFLTEDYLSVAVPAEEWQGAPRCPVTVS